ncbi:Polyketide cyclase / dehydrase and lipid transport [Aliiroseovarius crassostreae]|uniref:Polyketide cyclase n=1 Tax=Aliiroseovarius crassostreae TaxID=154981 RepID=A0A0N8IAX8_9RHOB|nr:SRPBCC family protein [Aliiroseovarius crassostreae]KPN61547.1 hypothetical protein AKJ29_18360 [Aliiroseovarius crassostreae]SFU92639.1 Polyketide cyclase / dehydrase and lipid transport [Aliiroseovarius crassostreae]
MFTWTYSETVPTHASASQIWAHWQDTENWPAWDSELDWVRLEGPFEVGTTGKMKPSAGPEVAFELSEVSHEKSFSDTARLPLTKMVFQHEYLPQPDTETGQIRHTVSMTGLLAPLFGQVIGRQIKAHLRSAMETLSTQAASPQMPDARATE